MKISRTFVILKKFVLMVSSLVKWSMVFIVAAGLVSARPAEWHPVHVSVLEINHNAAEKTLEISCRIFTDDFENVLRQNYQVKVDLIRPADRNAMDTLVKKYILSHFSVRSDSRLLQFQYLGFERDQESVFAYFQADAVPSVKKLEISNNIMYDFFTDQINIMHITAGGKRKSNKLDYPDSRIEFSF